MADLIDKQKTLKAIQERITSLVQNAQDANKKGNNKDSLVFAACSAEMINFQQKIISGGFNPAIDTAKDPKLLAPINKKPPILGQEAICPDGLGRVANYDAISGIVVDTYIDNRSCCWAEHNVELIDPRRG